MTIFLNTIIILLLLFLIYQDIMQRAVYWFLLPLLITGQIIVSIYKIGWEAVLLNASINLFLLVLQFLLLTLYFSFRNGYLVNVINKFIGLGDILFFIFLCFAFSPFNFIVFFVASLIVILILYSIVILKFNMKQYKIPLLGNMAIIYLILFVIIHLTRYNNFDDSLIVGLFF